MPLERYRQKRRFDETPEPLDSAQGKPSTGPPRFVVQKHEATRLHYDFRLEHDGVLLSWAVPKGPSLDPGDKHLAMMTEDHPLDYRTFEGVIPEGNYGAGNVMVWDEGNYLAYGARNRAESEEKVKAGLAKGHITFIVNGQKIRGEFALIKMENADDENAWLLIKKGDDYASKDDVTKQDKSVLTGRTMQEIERGKPPKDTPETKMPHHLRPMLASLTDEAFDDPGWVYEIKWDGYRVLAEIDHGKVELYSRNLQPFTDRFAPVAEALKPIKHQAVLDGEAVVLDENGVPRFQLLQNYIESGGGNLAYRVFDILYLDGHDLRDLPLIARKQLLTGVLPKAGLVQISEHVAGAGIAFFKTALAQGLEGIMAKRADSRYTDGKRSKAWLKIRTGLRQEVVIGGFTEPRGSRRGVGSLMLGVFEGGKLRFVGHSGGSFAGLSPEEVRAKLEPLEIPDCPFKTPPKSSTNQHWVKPQLLIEVAFTEWTAEGSMRHPLVLGFRDDKPAETVVQEKPVARSSKEEIVAIAGHKLKLTNRNKVYWPDEGYTKGDLIDYYRSVADYILPYLKGRPQSLNRFPNGITGESFYQKDVDIAPEWVTSVPIYSESNDKDIDYVVCDDEATLVWLANLGCIEMNAWNSRLDTLDKPDYLVIDLDPEDIGFEAVVEAALATKEVLDQAGVSGYPKTSGATGLHIYVPLGAKYDYDQTRQLAQLLATLIHHRLPKTTSIERSPAKRQGKVYLDYLQNRRGQTMAAPYCVRPKPGATVSAPLDWNEVSDKLDPRDFTIKNIHDRLKLDKELWRPVIGRGVDLAKVLKRLEENA